ncbi:MAG: hypothetical protein ACRD19_06050 [Terriglobia bacterium]
MARGSKTATTAATSAQNLSNGLASNANALYGSLAPELESEAAHPAGFAPSDLAAMRTGAMQSAGGSMAGAAGRGALLGARTRNAGAPAAAIGDAARTAGEQLSQRAVGIAGQNAELKAHQQQEGLSGLEGLNAEELGQGVNALGIVPGAVNANTNAANASYDWAKYLLDPAMQAAGQGAGMAFRG